MAAWDVRFVKRAIAYLIVLVSLVAVAPAARAQISIVNLGNDLDRAGFSLYGVSVFGGYISSHAPLYDAMTGGLAPYSSSFHTWSTGASFGFGWQMPKSDTVHLYVRFGGAYIYETSSTGFSGGAFRPTQSLSLGWGRTVTNKLSVSTSLSVAGGAYNQLLLLGDPNQILAGTPGTGAEYASAILSGTGGNSNLVSTATGANAIVAGQQNLLYGQTILTAAANFSATYALTPRLNLQGSVGANRMQHLPNGNEPTTGYLLHQSTGITASGGLSYSVTERLHVSGTVGYNYALSSLYTAPSLYLSGALGYMVTPHFFVHAGIGGGYVLSPSYQQSTPGYTPYHGLGWQANAGVGYRLLRHSFSGNFSRAVSDSYGLGASGTMLLAAGWAWHPTGSLWNINAGGAASRLEGTPYGNKGWRAAVGVSRRLAQRMYMSLSYGYGSGNSLLYLQNPISASSAAYHATGQTIQLNIGFSPHLGAQGFNPTSTVLQGP